MDSEPQPPLPSPSGEEHEEDASEPLEAGLRPPLWLGTLELVVVCVVVVAVLALSVWFVFFARHPLLRP